MGHYETLGLSPGASQDEIKRAYKKLALKNHPDRGGDAEKFKEISRAYETLSDQEKRAHYDRFGTDDPQPQMPDISEMFQHMFSGGGPPGMRAGPRDMNRHHTIDLTLEQVYTGVSKTIKVPVMKPCPMCAQQCQKCRGQGMLVQEMFGMIGQMFGRPCDACEGIGVSRQGCPGCNHQKRTIDTVVLNLNIEKGIQTGAQHMIRGLGEQARSPRERTGDLIITFNIKPHPKFERRGNDLRYVMTVSFQESVDGLDITVPHFGGPVELNTRQKFGILDPRRDYVIPGKGLDTNSNLLLNFDVQYPSRPV